MKELPAIVRNFFSVRESPTSEDDILICDYCGKTSLLKEWLFVKDSVYCEACGEHDGLKCPHCGYIHDYIFPRITLVKK